MAAEEAHVDPEIGKHARSLDEPERKQDTGPSFVETAIPIPDTINYCEISCSVGRRTNEENGVRINFRNHTGTLDRHPWVKLIAK